jgi:protein Mpv17
MSLRAVRSLRLFIEESYRIHPISANAVAGFITFSAGDALSQNISRPKKRNDVQHEHKIDYSRAFQTGFLGVFMNGFVLHRWYRVLDAAFGSSMRNNTRGIFLKTISDQLVYAPFSIAMFFSYTSAQTVWRTPSADSITDSGNRMRTFQEAYHQKMNQSFLSTWACDWMVWPAVNAINFRFVPINYRPTFIGVAQIMWQTFMSTVGHAKP